MARFVTQRRVQFHETDMAGIVHFANYYRWMEQAEHEFLRSLGLSIMQKRNDGTYIGWPRVSAQCRFAAPLVYEDEIEVHFDVERVGFKSVTYKVTFRKQGQLVAEGTSKAACCICKPDGKLESIEIPANYRSLLEGQT